MRNAMGLIQAIMMILIISGMMLIVLKYASISSKHTQNSFIREQNELYLTSIVEQTLLAISDHNRSDGCLKSYTPKDITKRNITYSAVVNITKYYLQIGSQDLSDCNTSGGIGIEESSNISHGMALLQVEVKATNGDGIIVSRILRRTLQQP